MDDHWANAIAAISAVYHQLSSLSEAATVFLLVSIFLNRRNLILVLQKLLPKSLKINLLIYFLDAFLVVGPLSYVLNEIHSTILVWDLVLIEKRYFERIPDLVLGVVVIFCGDAIGYFRHRFEHSRLLWSSHAMHHSDDDMTWFTVFRFHPINRLTTSVIDSGVLIVVGFPAWAILVNVLVRHYYGMLIHSNLPWTYGPVGYFLVSPAMHRWHHVLEGEGLNKNFASIFSLFDRVFRTFHLPGPCNEDTGVKGVDSNVFFLQLLRPVLDLRKIVRRR